MWRDVSGVLPGQVVEVVICMGKVAGIVLCWLMYGRDACHLPRHTRFSVSSLSWTFQSRISVLSFFYSCLFIVRERVHVGFQQCKIFGGRISTTLCRNGSALVERHPTIGRSPFVGMGRPWLSGIPPLDGRPL